MISESDWSVNDGVGYLHEDILQNTWTEITKTFTPTTDMVTISFGQFGPQDSVRMYFNDFSLVAGNGQEMTVIPPKPSWTPNASGTPANTFTPHRHTGPHAYSNPAPLRYPDAFSNKREHECI
jgi:hypothetical protein